ncbi:hypothetical protein RDWZM_005099 [Blomia tropicalis]|uniref:Uncharacterized protein n=1 Tax=Blomia tropicalis TaxID=40697 RepID=A0A9Q0M820_BLOTA|nr:hypothetical protein RDWZM_005099 [Blomia tropicalis]
MDSSSTAIRNRINQTNRSPVISYISPSSNYGLTAKTPNIIGSGNNHKKDIIHKEFTVKLSPFPNRNSLVQCSTIANPNSPITKFPVTTNEVICSNAETKQTFINDNYNPSTYVQSLSSNNMIQSASNESTLRSSNKRQIFSLEDDENIVSFGNYLKRPCNQILNQIDLDDDDDDSELMFEEPQNSVLPQNHKNLKRSTTSLDHELPSLATTSFRKRVRNNEILSSYSSSSNSLSNQLNKRKFSPENLSADSKVQKKRTVIEELELLTSETSPYYRNIYNQQSESITRPSKPDSTNHLPLEKDSSSKLTTSIEKIDDKSMVFEDSYSGEEDGNDIQISSVSPAAVTDNERIDEPNVLDDRVYPLPTHIFSIKDHEYDRKKSQNRLDRFMAAVQQSCEGQKKEQQNEQAQSKTFVNIATIETPKSNETIAGSQIPTPTNLLTPSSSSQFALPKAPNSNIPVLSNPLKGTSASSVSQKERPTFVFGLQSTTSASQPTTSISIGQVGNSTNSTSNIPLIQSVTTTPSIGNGFSASKPVTSIAAQPEVNFAIPTTTTTTTLNGNYNKTYKFNLIK